MSIENKIENFLATLTNKEIKELESRHEINFGVKNNTFTIITNEEIEDEEISIESISNKDIKRLKAIYSKIKKMENQVFEGILFGSFKLICKINFCISIEGNFYWDINDYDSSIICINDDFIKDSSFNPRLLKSLVKNHLKHMDFCGEELDLVRTLPEYKKFEKNLNNLCDEFVKICQTYDENIEIWSIWDELEGQLVTAE